MLTITILPTHHKRKCTWTVINPMRTTNHKTKLTWMEMNPRKFKVQMKREKEEKHKQYQIARMKELLNQEGFVCCINS